MKKSISKLMALALIIALISSFAAFSASAITYMPIGGSTTVTKNLVVDADANIPDITFTYTITRVPGTAATASTIEIIESPVAATIGTATFSNLDTSSTHSGVPSDPSGTTTTGKKYAQKSVDITFPVVSFTKPGVYRYVINEANGGVPGVTYDTTPRYLDVFVVANNSNVLSVNSYVVRNTATSINIDGTYTTDAGAKGDGFTNSISQYDFSFNKAISGNQGDKNKRFTFTLSISNAIPGTYPLTAVDVTGDPTSITVASDGTYSGTFDLTNNSSVTVLGLNSGAVCTVSEDAQDYTATHIVDSGSSVTGASSGTLNISNSNRTVAFTNKRDGVIPTGVLLTVAPFAIGLLLFGAVGVTMLARKKEEE